MDQNHITKKIMLNSKYKRVDKNSIETIFFINIANRRYMFETETPENVITNLQSIKR